MSHENRLDRATNSSLENAFKTQISFGRGRGQGRSNYQGGGRSPQRGGINNPPSKSRRGSNQNQSEGSSQHQAQGQRYEKSQVQCHYCKKYGNYANEYRKKQNDMNNRKNTNFAKEYKN